MLFNRKTRPHMSSETILVFAIPDIILENSVTLLTMYEILIADIVKLLTEYYYDLAYIDYSISTLLDDCDYDELSTPICRNHYRMIEDSFLLALEPFKNYDNVRAKADFVVTFQDELTICIKAYGGNSREE